jgi:pimeloyl-ACP methyl ester carboxylesterase
MPKLTLSSGVVHYREAGQGTPLILLHANPGDSLDFAAVIPALSKKYRVLALDWPGYGDSSPPEQLALVGPRYFYNVLREFMDVLALPPVFIIGNSLGGNAAARLAIEAPELVRGLVLVSPGGFTPHSAITRAFCRLQSSRLAFSPHFFASHYLDRRSPAVEAMLLRAETTQSCPSRVALNRAVWRSFAQPDNDLRLSARNIKAPTLLVFGQHDPVIPYKKDGAVATNAIHGSKLVVLPSGHAPFAEVPDAFLLEVFPFLAQCG